MILTKLTLRYFSQVGENLALFCKVPILVPFIYKLLNYRCCCSEDGT